MASRLALFTATSISFVFILLNQLLVPMALAENGDLVHTTNFSSPCQSGLGVGIAFDGEFLWYSCYRSSPDLYKAEALTGTVVASYNIAGGLGALAWDGSRKMIWAGWGGGSGASGDVRLIDPTTGTATIEFNAAAAVIVGLDDGLAYDAQDDTLYISDDVSTTIYHYSHDGSLLDSFSWAGSSCYNSGLAIGGELLFQGSNGCNHVWVVKRSDLSPAFDFPTGGVRDEDLECDSVTFSPQTVMWSMEAYDENFGDPAGRRAIAFEIPPGTCATGGGVDSDGDGLLDEWETDGVTIDPDGDGPILPQFIDLPAMGADKDKPDIFLHIDWMQDANHNHALDSAAIEKVVDAFANSPYISSTESVGINLHVDQGPNSILDFTTNTTWGALSRARALTHVNNLGTSSGGMYDWSAFQAIKDEPGGFTETGRTPIFHYVISAHNYDATTSSGISRGIGASDFIVSLGSFTGGVGSINQQAGTLMHEFGHNLNLRHGGDDNVNYKPNYLSIMNYSFQLQGVIKNGMGGTIDYSHSTLGSLNETDLDEPNGLGASAAGFGTRHFCNNVYTAVTSADGAIDWNCDGDDTDVGTTADVNGDVCVSAGNNGVLDTTPIGDDTVYNQRIYVGPNRTCDTTATGDDVQFISVGAQRDPMLHGYNDWANLQLKGGAIGLAGVNPDLPMETEEDLLTVEVAEQILPLLEVINVAIDIKPGSDPNSINPRNREVIPVAILTTDDFDATTVDPLSVRFGLDGAVETHGRGHIEDVDGDGDNDMVLHFRTQETGIVCGDITAALTGQTLDGTPIEGSDSIRTVGCR